MEQKGRKERRMKIFTNRGFEKEIERRMEVRDEREYVRKRLYDLEEKIERLYRIVEDLRLGLSERKEE